MTEMIGSTGQPGRARPGILGAFGGVPGTLLARRRLVVQLVRRDVQGRYRGAFLGVLWSLVNPLLMLAVYSFVFGVVFKSRWRPEGGGMLEFAVVMFAGLIVHGFFAEVANRSPTLIVGNANYVKKVVFPLEVLPWMAVGSALFHLAIATVVLLGGIVALQGSVPPTALLAPVVLAPFVLVAVGTSWLLASLGVYLRDLAQLIGVAVSLLMFLSPVFYPLGAVPESLRAIVRLNPLTFVIEQFRAAVIWGSLPDWQALALYAAVAWVFAAATLAWFQATRRGFADVV